MDVYDLMYAKDALNIYIFLFSNINLNKEKEFKIKDIIYVLYMYCFYYKKTQSVQKFFELFQEINYIEDIDNLLNEDTHINQLYQLFKIHEDILQKDKKNEYQLYLDELKQLILKTNFNDILYFLKIKKEVDETYEKFYNENISKEELEILTSDLTNKLEYLANYLPSNDIEAYKTYFEVKKGQSPNFIADLGIKLFEFKKNDMKIDFSELEQLGELKKRTHLAIPLKKYNLGTIKLEEEERKQIRKCALINIFIDVIVIIILYAFLGRLGIVCYKNFIKTQNTNLLIPIIIFFPIVILFFINILKYILVIWKSKKSEQFTGIIGFVGDISWSRNRNRKFYHIYFPKYNAQYSINYIAKKAKRKDMVKVIKISNEKIVIPTNVDFI